MTAGIALGLFLLISSQVQAETGIASFYDYAQPLACGGRYDRNSMTAAHKTLPCGTRIKVTNKLNGRMVTVTVRDRGPYRRPSRIVDLSFVAARELDMLTIGLIPVTVEVVK